MVTINDVAKLAGVSRSTASRAFTPNSSIKQITKEKVFTAAKQLNYSPNFSARSLVTQKKYVIGVFMSRIHADMSTYFSNIISSANAGLPSNYLLSVAGIDQLEDFDQSVRNRFDGVIVVSQSKNDDTFIDKLKEARIPTVVVLRRVDLPEIDNIYANDRVAMHNLVQYIYQQGHRRLGIINGSAEFITSEVRYIGIKEQAKKLKMNIVPSATKQGQFSLTTGEVMMNEILNQPRSDWPTCVICASDDIALGALKACHQHDLSVPRDISLTGFDNIPYSMVSTPSLTTIENPLSLMIENGMKFLLQRISNSATERQTLVIEPSLIIRSSVSLQ
ncbi:LacI family DNA-binding transcriptional regulator [Limosilactobacillus sp. RRLNB_1_1]|uniref:LacI family DNA-binding transcriptional regulator n=1 Tax=Limosilactobacillus albertensis TaxID=2759752 RepID=A0A7W3TS39_9LACO|nr:LacI family DNA-binding transcriptional regulator [Limosilactobacillus albertensis]MBB1069586.1 LacI family DNA-binding transcriptional regulator [Limosilactobacillus albertensis]MCD7118113.1 LacI family transcriptional regulator [Limosilactobacillus albertensis]MCD7127633.1 LacI family transcriptional regulator [Limosilactobacillus albertensis]